MKNILLSLLGGLVMVVGTAGAAKADYCREYTETFRIDGRLQTGYGTACLQPDGSWQVVSPAEPEAAVQYVEPVQPAYYPSPVYYAPQPSFLSISFGSRWGGHRGYIGHRNWGHGGGHNGHGHYDHHR